MKKIIIMAAAMLFSWQGIQAQNDNAEDNDDVITVTDKNGTVLQSTNGEPQQMPASQFGQIHPMLAEGITAMHVGDHFKFYVNLGAEVPQNFKPYDFIVFDVKLVEPAAAEKAEPEK